MALKGFPIGNRGMAGSTISVSDFEEMIRPNMALASGRRTFPESIQILTIACSGLQPPFNRERPDESSKVGGVIEMRKIVITLISTAFAIGLASPAMAHPTGTNHRHERLHDRLEDRHYDGHDRLDSVHEQAHDEGIGRRQHRRLHRYLGRQHNRQHYRLEDRHEGAHNRQWNGDYGNWNNNDDYRNGVRDYRNSARDHDDDH